MTLSSDLDLFTSKEQGKEKKGKMMINLDNGENDKATMTITMTMSKYIIKESDPLQSTPITTYTTLNTALYFETRGFVLQDFAKKCPYFPLGQTADDTMVCFKHLCDALGIVNILVLLSRENNI